jgi:hypothetical protein
MRLFHSNAAILICFLSATVAMAQNRVPSTQPAASSQAQTVIERAAAANKYVFILFWNQKNQQTDKAFETLQAAMTKMADKADMVSVQIADPAEKKLIDKYGVNRAPMPLVVAIAPCGAITKAFPKAFDEKQLQTAFVSPCTQLCLKGLQSGKLVFVCVVDQANPQDPMVVPKGVKDFKADKKFNAATEIVTLNVRDAGETTFMKELEIGSQSAPITIFLAPPGAMIGKFGSEATKDILVAKLAAAQSNPCAGGKCGPGGCK